MPLRGGSFSYATLPGATYAGLPYALTASGSYDPVAHTGSWTSTATLLGANFFPWTAHGSLAPSASDSSKLAVSFTTSAAFCSDCRTEIAIGREVLGFVTIDWGTQTILRLPDGNRRRT